MDEAQRESLRSHLAHCNEQYLATERGLVHLASYARARKKAQANFEYIAQLRASNGEWQDQVLLGFLPHLDTSHNRAKGAWIHVAPAVTRDLRQWFENAGWTRPEQWPDVAAAVLDFVSEAVRNPACLKPACQAFANHPSSKGLQAGFLSPILNALRPEDYRIVNGKTREVLKEFIGENHSRGIIEYPESNEAAGRLVAAVRELGPSGRVADALDCDVADAFCHWYVALRPKTDRIAIQRLTDRKDPAAAGAWFVSTYPDESERAACMALFADAVTRAHTYGASRWEVTLQRRHVRLNVGALLALELAAEWIRFGVVRDEIPLKLRELVQNYGGLDDEPFKTQPVTTICSLPVTVTVEHSATVWPLLTDFIAVAAGTAVQSPYHQAHSPGVVDFLRTELDRDLPDAEYRERKKSAAPKTEQSEEVIAFQHPRTLFRKVDYDLEGLLNFVKTGFIGLPDIQRPFVWTPTKVRDLFDSMYRGFPVGYLLFWSNQEVRGTRGIGLDAKQHIPSQLVVDGQQRLTSLYAVFSGRPVVDSEFRPARIEIAFRPRDGRFEVTDAAIRNDPEFIPDISAFWTSNRSSWSLINDFLTRLKARKTFTEEQKEVISHNLDRLFDLKKYPFTALEIDPSVNEESVANIFVRINSEGVKLNQADFILTLLSVFWDEGRAALETFSRQSRTPVSPGGGPSPFNYVIQPGPDRLLRAVVGLGFHRGRLKSVYQVLRGKDVETGRFVEELRERQFSRLKEAQQQVLDLNNWHLFLACLREGGFRAGDMISSEIAAIFTYVFYLIGRQQCGVEEHLLQRLIARWFFAVSLTARYAGSVESTMDEDLGRIRHATTPEAFVSALEDLIRAELTGDFWGITLPAQFETSSSRSPSLTAYHAAQCILRTPVLFSSKVLTDYLDPSVRGPRNAVERHHLFPRDYLKRTGISDRRLVNQVGNLAYVEWPENLAIRAMAPGDYIPRLRARFDDSTWVRMSRDHALPDQWETLSYAEFLEQRRVLMARVVRRGFEVLAGPRPEGVDLSDGSSEEQTAWKMIEAIELDLRALVRCKYEQKWGEAADRRMREVLGEAAWGTIERNRASYVAKYGDNRNHDPVLDFAYLGQLSQLMIANQVSFGME